MDTSKKARAKKLLPYYWLGSDLPDPMIQPDYFYEYGKGGSSQDKIDQTIRVARITF